MRDRFLKEVRMEIKSKKQGEIVQSRWKYRQLMNFIAPFTGSRSGVADICGNNDDDRGNNDDDHDNPDNESGCVEGETTSSETVKTPQSIMKVPASPAVQPQVTYVSQLPTMSQDSQMAQLAALAKMPSSSQQITPISKTGRKRRLMQESVSPPSSQSTPSPTKWLVKDNGSSFPNRPRDEDELFLLSFVPALKRLAPQKRCETKIKIQQIMYEAEFNVSQPESHEKRSDSETRD
ncbi:hypothetical protein PAMP_013324 [Pampus punctatissimus]